LIAESEYGQYEAVAVVTAAATTLLKVILDPSKPASVRIRATGRIKNHSNN
jgi:hypothetical protein